MTQKHTPTPWGASHAKRHSLVHNVPLGREYQVRVEVTGESHEANAAFIVRAVNAHDDLVKALEPFARMARGMSEVEQMDHVLFKRLDSEGRVMLDQITADDFVRALAALAKAGAPCS
jgi:hypothetical protein